MFRVTYYKYRINLEVFHVLTDGMGGISFLKELTYQYLRLAHPQLASQVGDSLSSDTSLNREDSFLKNYKEPCERLSDEKGLPDQGGEAPARRVRGYARLHEDTGAEESLPFV